MSGMENMGRDAYRRNPAQQLESQESNERKDLPIDVLADTYDKYAKRTLESVEGMELRQIISAYGDDATNLEGAAQAAELDRLAGRLAMKSAFKDSVPDEDYEQRAAALALLREHKQTLH